MWMENFILYEELGAGSSSVVYKGRKKGTLKYVAIICTDKAKRPDITNHVRLSHDLDHLNIVCFYEWYETNNHLWLVVELCTGGSLESVIGQDGCLPEDVVRKFGWDLVKGLKHIHELGIIFSDLNPAKILLDGSGSLKIGNFRKSKAEGETLEDFYTLFSGFEETGEQDCKVTMDDMKERLRGSLTYSAPEVLQGSETSVSSDLWALGCILYYMYTGKPPFNSDSYRELKEMILYQEPSPLRRTVLSFSPPSEDFQNLLIRLLIKNPEKRMDWQELLVHPFWTQIQKEEEDEEGEKGHPEEECSCEGIGSSSLRETKVPDASSPEKAYKIPTSYSGIIQPADRISKTDCQEVVRHATCGVIRNSQGLDREVGKERGGEKDDRMLSGAQQLHNLQSNKSFTLDNVSELKPKCGVDDDNTDAIFLLSSCAIPKRSCRIPDSLKQIPDTQGSPGIDVTSCVKTLLYTDADLTITPIIDNPKILKCPPGRFDPKTLGFPAFSVEKLLSLGDEEWAVYFQQLCSSLGEQNSSAPPSYSSTGRPFPSTVIRSKLNLLCYLSSVVVNKVIANRLLNSTLLPLLIQQLRQASNWDVRSRVLKVMGLLALHCTDIKEENYVSETVCILTDLLRDNLRNSTIKRFLLPPLGEFLYLITSQEKKRGSPEGLWFVPAAAYTGLMRSLREGDDPIVHQMAAKAIENIATVVGPSHQLVTTDIGSALWYLFTHSTVEAVRVTAISSLSRLARVVPAVFLAVIDTCGPAAILEDVGRTGARVRQHLLTAMATAFLSSRTRTHRFTQNKHLVLRVLRCLETPSTVSRAKVLLLLLLLIQENTHTLLYCCQQRLLIYIERDLCEATPLRENPNQSAYLSQCLDLLVVHLNNTASIIMEEVLGALRSVIGRRHPSTAQSRQLKYTLPTLSVVLELLLSKVFRALIVTEDFLAQIGLLMKYITSIESNETDLTSALGAALCEELIRTSLSIVDILNQHHALTSLHHSVVVDTILPPMISLVFSRNVEWSVFVLRVLSELSRVQQVQERDSSEDDEGMDKKTETGEQEGRAAKGMAKESQILTRLAKLLLPRFESLLRAADPRIPMYALKVLVSMTEHSTQICSLIKHSTILPTVFQMIMEKSDNVNKGTIQNTVALLCNLSKDTILDLDLEGLIQMVVSTISETALAHLNEDRRAGRKFRDLVLQACLEVLHHILKQTSVVVHSALQSQRLTYPGVEMEAAEKLLLQNRPLSQLSPYLIHMLSTENKKLWEESLQCLSLLVQLYGGEGDDCLSPSCLQCFSHVLGAHMQTESLRIQCTTLQIIKRLVQTPERADWLECPEGAELMTLLQDMSTSNRCHIDVVPLAAEILTIILGS